MLPSRHGSQHINGPVLAGGYHHHSSELFILKSCWKKIQQEEAASLILLLSNQNGALHIKNQGAKAASLDVCTNAGCSELWPRRFTTSGQRL